MILVTPLSALPPLLVVPMAVIVLVSPTSGSVSLASTVSAVSMLSSFTVKASFTATGGSLRLLTFTVTVAGGGEASAVADGVGEGLGPT